MKVAWAINPFDTNRKVFEHGVEILRNLSPKYIELIFVSAPSVLDLSLAFDIPEKDRFDRYAKERLEKAKKDFKIKANKSTVIQVPSSSTSVQVTELSSYLAREKFDLVLMPTHARTGVDRFFQGSFTETLILNSKTDLLVYSPKLTKKFRLKKVLFAHDGSKSATNQLTDLNHHLKNHSVHIDVLHVLPTISNIDNGTILFAENYQHLLDKNAKLLKNKISKINPAIEFKLKQTNQSISDTVVSTAKRLKSDVVVVNAKIGSLLAGLGGSISRQVIRKSTCPVWVKK